MAKYEYPVYEQVEQPIEASLDGKRNAYTFECEILESHQNFAACMHKVAERKHGALKLIFTDCSVAISKKRCPALAMRKAEVEKGVAIYFIERRKFVGIAALVDKAKNFFTPVKPALAPAAPKTLLDGLKLDTYADAINTSIKTTQAALVVNKNETPLEAARRLLALRQVKA